MAITQGMHPQPAIAITEVIQQACDDYRHYIEFILEPARDELEGKVRNDEVKLHHAFGANLILAHSVDYLQAVRTAIGIKETRKDLVKAFDEKFSIAGAYIDNRKMELIDAINNALKHIRVDPVRYKKLGDQYGQISFKSLIEDEGGVVCHIEKYRFDYCRVVLLAALRALSNWNFELAEDVLDFAQGHITFNTITYSDTYDSDDPSTAIDRMIELCSSPCMNCEEEAEDCRCSQYVFDGEEGHFDPLHSVSNEQFEFIMDQISPSYSRS
ncbi:hypothetical protein PSH58_21790 [Pseudomonas hefeiensis]|uniref:Uncharacterized protein n=1 Tax=Pseudomonas hefeiensis TaxID=2738125 RepID=A0ABY9G7E4_9PSED|nr:MULTISPECIES: hypothetical protein [unclassified Pseudomonas]WLH11461.1 hypothetical protein PSH57_21755 [Pseudomonas sp. FP205]WLH94530.1 hypothetical protein PSH58_21790 [Pseudomonas sp. FP53]WLI38810.1 hypothetical protein PSH74_21735 [Pseudomonas sp. FP821]